MAPVLRKSEARTSGRARQSGTAARDAESRGQTGLSAALQETGRQGRQALFAGGSDRRSQRANQSPQDGWLDSLSQKAGSDRSPQERQRRPRCLGLAHFNPDRAKITWILPRRRLARPTVGAPTLCPSPKATKTALKGMRWERGRRASQGRSRAAGLAAYVEHAPGR